MRSSIRIPILALTSLAALLGGCASAPTPNTPAVPAIAAGRSDCGALYARFDDLVDRAGVHDALAARVAGFPFLRVSRFLASFREHDLTDQQLGEWIERMHRLDRDAREVERANLPPKLRAAAPTLDALEGCAARMRAAALRDPSLRSRLAAAAQVPDEYRDWQRVAGLYWLSAWPISTGVERLHREIRRTYATPIAKLPVAGELVDYRPPPAEPLSRAGVAAILAASAQGPLGIPRPDRAQRERLFAAFAPRWQIDTASAADRIGAPRWKDAGAAFPQVDGSAPTVYRLMSHTWYRGRALLQLNYVVWFPERPLASRFDMLGGKLDGLIWRVTLAPDGTVLVYDSIHDCGCYQLFFPRAGLCPRPAAGELEESTFVPEQAPVIEPGRHPTLRVAHDSHFLDRVSTAPPPARRTLVYRWADYDALRSLAAGDGRRRSLFGPDGVVPGTDRGERYVLWPMGIPAPGAMREWGHHATAFLGRRHFDDAHLMERSFEQSSRPCADGTSNGRSAGAAPERAGT